MDTKQIKQVIALFEESKVHSMELEVKDMKIRLEKPVTQIVSKVEVPSTKETFEEEVSVSSDYFEVKSPLVGTFYEAANEKSKPYVSIGTVVKEGDTLCIIEAMKVMNEIKASRDGVIKEIKVKSGEMVQFDDVLFTIGD